MMMEYGFMGMEKHNSVLIVNDYETGMPCNRGVAVSRAEIFTVSLRPRARNRR